MAYPVTFDKDKAGEWSDALGRKREIRCPDGGWGINDMLTLAGVCMMGVMSHGPVHYKLDKERYEQMPYEHREASEVTFEKDLFASICFCSELAFFILDEKYDDRFDEVVKVLIYMDGDEKVIHPITGIED
jgi:hypothetical protein